MLRANEAPDKPGLYAWYATFNAGPQDWKTRPEDGQDAAIGSYVEMLRRYAAYHAPIPISLRGQASYQSHWHGVIALHHGLTEQEDCDSGSDEVATGMPGSRERLTDAVASEQKRMIFSQLLATAAPVFSNPLYIGVAKNLRERLGQHKRDFERATGALGRQPSGAAALRRQGVNFGARAAGAGLSMDNLRAWVVELGEDQAGLRVEAIREAAESVEWLLHQIFSPVLGEA